MGLNIGVEVHQQEKDGGYETYTLPKESLEELSEKLHNFLEQRFPGHYEKGMFGHSVEFNTNTKVYEFDCRLGHYGDELGKAGYQMVQLYQALLEFVLSVFSYDDLQMRTYWSG